MLRITCSVSTNRSLALPRKLLSISWRFSSVVDEGARHHGLEVLVAVEQLDQAAPLLEHAVFDAAARGEAEDRVAPDAGERLFLGLAARHVSSSFASPSALIESRIRRSWSAGLISRSRILPATSVVSRAVSDVELLDRGLLGDLDLAPGALDRAVRLGLGLFLEAPLDRLGVAARLVDDRRGLGARRDQLVGVLLEPGLGGLAVGLGLGERRRG